MKIIKPTFEIWFQKSSVNGIYQQIERAGRVCYKSEKNMTADSARPFCERMMNSKHYAMLEHGSVYLLLSSEVGYEIKEFYSHNRFSHYNEVNGVGYVSTNLRVLAENNRLDDLKYLVEPSDNNFDKRVTVHFTTQVAITREFNRHRVNSIAEQSTRYCNYSKDKFANQIAVNVPTWVAELEQNNSDILRDDVVMSDNEMSALFKKIMTGEATDIENWLFANLAAEKTYMNLIANGRKPQEARVVLPLDVNTELVHTAFVSDWLHFFDLRALDKTGAAHPDAKVLALPLYEEFKRKGLI